MEGSAGFEAGLEAKAFSFLKRLAEIYHVDVRKLIISSNRTRFSKVPRSYWATDDYPIYIEGKADLKKIQNFKGVPSHLSVGSVGWLLWALRKNPFNYIHTKAIAKKVGVHFNRVKDWEANRGIPNFHSLKVASQILGRPLPEIIQALNDTFYHDLPLDELFPGLPIYIDPKPDDVKKIESYAANPGTLGQWLFAYRSTLLDRPGSKTLSYDSEGGSDYINDRENNRIQVGRETLHEWIWLFRELEIPLDLLKATVEEVYEIPKDDPAYLLAEAVGDKTYKQVVEEAILAPHIITDFLKGSGRKIRPENILALQNVLPALRGDRLFLSIYPHIREIFPETNNDSPYLLVSREEILSVFDRFHLGEAIFAFRMDPPEGLEGVRYEEDGSINLSELARYLGVTRDALRKYERQYQWIKDDETIVRIGRGLGLDLQEFYLHYRPEILRLFQVVDVVTGKPFEVSEKRFRNWVRLANKRYDRSNLRKRITPFLSPAMRGNGDEDPSVVLSKILKISPKKAEKFLDFSQALNLEEIKILTHHLTGLSDPEWYEHFDRAYLNFFLGRHSDRSFNYSLPEGMTWKDFDQWDLIGEIQRSVETRPLQSKEEKILERILSKFEEGKLPLQSIPFLSRKSGIDKRDIYLWSRRHEQKPMIQAANPE